MVDCKQPKMSGLMYCTIEIFLTYIIIKLLKLIILFNA